MYVLRIDILESTRDDSKVVSQFDNAINIKPFKNNGFFFFSLNNKKLQVSLFIYIFRFFKSV